MTIAQLIAQLRAKMASKLEVRNSNATRLAELRGIETPTDEQTAEVEQLREANTAIDAEIDQMLARENELKAEQDRDDAAARLATEVHPTGASGPARDRAPARVGAEERTYRVDQDPKGRRFAQDVAASFFGDFGARERLARHMNEEKVERGQDYFDRAVGTGAFTGLVVPQYLTDLYAPKARAGRPFADACRHHDLPPTGMTAYISQITTGTNVDDQSAENAAVPEQDEDDTLLQIDVKTAAGQQTISRQAAERGVGIEDVTIEDLFRAHGTNLDSKLLNRAVVGLSAVSTSIAYTDGTPTAAELYPKLMAANSGVEGALLDQDPGDTFATMHSRRWNWMQSQLTSTWPMFGQPGVAAQLGGTNYGERYGGGFRGVLPNGTPVIVDNNVATNLGAGTNEDEIYFAAQSECHLWEDPNAPMLIRAEQAKAASLGILLVVYSYYAATFARLAHAQKIAGTGLVTPVFA